MLSPCPYNRQPSGGCFVQQCADHGGPSHAGRQNAASQLWGAGSRFHELPAAEGNEGGLWLVRRMKEGEAGMTSLQRRRQLKSSGH